MFAFDHSFVEAQKTQHDMTEDSTNSDLTDHRYCLWIKTNSNSDNNNNVDYF